MGLNTHVSELFIEDYSSPDLNNVDLHPAGSIKKRRGMDVLREGLSLEDRSTPFGTGAMQALFHLPRNSDGRDILVGYRGDILSLYDVNDNDGWLDSTIIVNQFTKTFDAAIGPFNDEAGTADDATDDVYRGECLYIVDGQSHPLIVSGTDVGFGTGITVNAVTGGPAGTKIQFGCTSAHGLRDGDLIRFNGPDADAWIIRLTEYLVYTVGLIDENNFIICDRDLEVLHVPTAETWLSDPTWSGVTVHKPNSIHGWPAGKYSTAGVVPEQRGYPKRWVDPNSDATYTHFPYSDDHAMPSGIEIMGSGMSLRAYAYGFPGDPDRIDVSELGAPYNFLRNDVDAADAASAIKQPGVDGGYFYCRRGDGDKVIGVREFRGLIIVFKRHTTVIYSGMFGYDMRQVQTISVGATSNDSIIVTGNDVFFWSMDGPRNLSVTDRFGDLLVGSISENVIEVVRGVTGSAQKKICGYHDRMNKRVVWHFPANGGDTNNAVLAFYYPDGYDPRGRWTRYSGAYCEQVKAIGSRMVVSGQERQYGASTDGYVYELNVGVSDDRDWTGYPTTPLEDLVKVPISSYYITRWFALGEVDVTKRMLDVFIAYNEDGAGESKLYQAQNYLTNWTLVNDPVGAAGDSEGYWNYFYWNYPDIDPIGSETSVTVDAVPEDTDLFYWDTTGRAFVQHRLKGLVHIVRFKIEDSGLLPYGIGGLVIDARAKGKRS